MLKQPGGLRTAIGLLIFLNDTQIAFISYEMYNMGKKESICFAL